MIRFAKVVRSILFLGMLLFLPLSGRAFPEKLYTDSGKKFDVGFIKNEYKLDKFGRRIAPAYYVRLSTDGERVIRIGYLLRMYVNDTLKLSEDLNEPISFYFDQTDSRIEKRRAWHRPTLRREKKWYRVDTPPLPNTPPFVDLDDSDDLD